MKSDIEHAQESTESSLAFPKPSGFDTLLSLNHTSAYLREVEAEPINFRTAYVRTTESGYSKIVGSVDFDPSIGSVRVKGDIEAPSESRAIHIAEELKTAKFPKHYTSTVLPDAPKGLNIRDDSIFVFKDFLGQNVMLQQRIETLDGKKYIPWTRWSDNEWRNMEPEGFLPFYGTESCKDSGSLFVHEGPKAARKINRIIDGSQNAVGLPWIEELRWAAHIGWIGGVHSVERSDWVGLANRNWNKVIIVADNDTHGKRAAQKIAKFFRCKVGMIVFDEQFPTGFDLADDCPLELFDEDGIYTGPKLRDLEVPATQATYQIENCKNKNNKYGLRDIFAKEVACIIDGPKFVFRDEPSDILTEAEFNAITAPFSDVGNTAARVLGRVECQHRKLGYHPGRKPGTMELEGEIVWNCYQPPKVMPMEGDCSIWSDYLEHLIPESVDRELLMKWIATLISKPDIRMRYGLLLISQTQGVGKNTLANVLKVLLGSKNVSFPNEQAVTESQFNGWIAHKRLTFVAEIYSGSSRKAYDKIKAFVADDYIEVNEKYTKPYMVQNWAVPIFCSNSINALHLDDTDRRLLVPVVSEQTKPSEWWNQFYSWFEGEGAAIILKWSQNYVENKGFVRTGDRAPMTVAKQKIIEESRSEGIQIAHDLFSQLQELDSKQAVTMRDLRSNIAILRGLLKAEKPDLGHKYLEKASTILKAITPDSGIYVLGKKGGCDRRPRIDGCKEIVLLNFDPKDQPWLEMRKHLITFEELRKYDPF